MRLRTAMKKTIERTIKNFILNYSLLLLLEEFEVVNVTGEDD